MKVLLEHGADIDAVSPQFGTALMLALLGKNKRMRHSFCLPKVHRSRFQGGFRSRLLYTIVPII